MLRKSAFCALVLWSFSSLCLARSPGDSREKDIFEEDSESKGRSNNLVKVAKAPSSKFEARAPKTQDYFNYLPFGTGQFRQNKQVLGLGLAAAQAGSLALYFSSKSQLDSSHKDIHSVMQNAEATKNFDPGLYSYLEKSEKFEKKAQMEARIALFSFIGFYALGVVDAVYDPLNSISLFSKGSIASDKTAKPSKERASLAKTRTKPKSRNRVGPSVTPERGKPAYGVAFARDF